LNEKIPKKRAELQSLKLELKERESELEQK
jgi:hypothetical protein